jgi:hypothetical protein
MLALFYGDQTPFAVTTFGVPGVERDFTSFSSAVAQVSDARVFAGIHFRFACDAAVQMGIEIADYVASTVAVPSFGRFG